MENSNSSLRAQSFSLPTHSLPSWRNADLSVKQIWLCYFPSQNQPLLCRCKSNSLACLYKLTPPLTEFISFLTTSHPTTPMVHTWVTNSCFNAPSFFWPLCPCAYYFICLGILFLSFLSHPPRKILLILPYSAQMITFLMKPSLTSAGWVQYGHRFFLAMYFIIVIFSLEYYSHQLTQSWETETMFIFVFPGYSTLPGT